MERVDPAKMSGVELRMETLAAATSPDTVRAASGHVVKAYREWINAQRDAIPPDEAMFDIAMPLFDGSGFRGFRRGCRRTAMVVLVPRNPLL